MGGGNYTSPSLFPSQPAQYTFVDASGARVSIEKEPTKVWVVLDMEQLTNNNGYNETVVGILVKVKGGEKRISLEELVRLAGLEW